MLLEALNFVLMSFENDSVFIELSLFCVLFASDTRVFSKLACSLSRFLEGFFKSIQSLSLLMLSALNNVLFCSLFCSKSQL